MIISFTCGAVISLYTAYRIGLSRWKDKGSRNIHHLRQQYRICSETSGLGDMIYYVQYRDWFAGIPFWQDLHSYKYPYSSIRLSDRNLDILKDKLDKYIDEELNKNLKAHKIQAVVTPFLPVATTADESREIKTLRAEIKKLKEKDEEPKKVITHPMQHIGKDIYNNPTFRLYDQKPAPVPGYVTYYDEGHSLWGQYKPTVKDKESSRRRATCVGAPCKTCHRPNCIDRGPTTQSNDWQLP